MYERHCILIWAHTRARSGRTAHAFDRIDGTDTHSGPNRNARDPLRTRVLKALISRAARNCGHEDMRKQPQLHRFASRFCKQASGSISEANAVCRLACRAMSAAKPTGDSDAAALLYPPAPARARPSSLRARDSYRRSTGSKVACGRAVASERQVGLSFLPRPGSSGRLQLSRR